MEKEGAPSEPEKRLEILPDADWFVALGKNFDTFAKRKDIRFEGTSKLGRMSPATKLIAQAAADILMAEPGSKVLFSTGNAGDPQHLTESESMLWFVHETYGIAMDRMAVEPLSTDTKENAENCAYMLKNVIGKPIRVLSVEYHFPRALDDFKAAGFVQATSITAEALLEGKVQYKEALDEHQKSLYHIAETVKESAAKILPPSLRKVVVRLQGRK